MPNSTVTLTRTGGFAGVNDQYIVTPDGMLTVLSRNKQPQRKQLPAATVQQLKSLVTSSALVAEAQRGPVLNQRCRDGFNYALTTGSVRLAGTDCGGLAQQAPNLWKVVQLIQAAAHNG